MALRSGALALAACFGIARCDLPVHCLRHQVVGEWRFVHGPASATRTSCGHRRPDAEDAQPERAVALAGQKTTETALHLTNPNVAKSDSTTGTWTMVYDEGFEVRVGSQIYFAFSNYTMEPDAHALTKHNVSHCGDTMVGWYQNKERTAFGCFYGYKVEKPAAVALHAKTPVAPQATSLDTPLDHKAQAKKVAKLNKKLSMLQKSWRARPMEKWNGKTLRELNSYAGIRRTTLARDLHLDMLKQRAAESSRERSFLQVQRAQGAQHSGPPPKSFDWSDADGKNFLDPVMDQADCGSCYAASSTRMMTARHKVRQDDPDAVPWSINFPLMCSEYNQGCKGGYGFLNAKWSGDVGLLPATCMRYNTAGTCKLECDLDKLEGKRFRAANHRYVGNFYANTSEAAIMEELYHNGPLTVGIEPAEDFMYYSDGIYSSATTINLLHKEDQEWERVDHAILLVGWGEEDGKKYWRIQNSWGPDWGEDGFFRILRGENESGIESIPEAADVIEDEQGGKQVKAFFEEMKGSA